MRARPELPQPAARARAFGGVVPAEAYDRLRPGYPAEAIPWLLNDPPRPLRVLDLGAGTGKLSAALREAGHEVIALDPSPEMLGVLSRRLPEVTVLVGRGENIPLGDESVDAVTVGQAWHWMDRARAAREVGRVLRPGAGIGLTWNVPDAGIPWVAELRRLTSDQAPGSPDTERHEPPAPFAKTAERAVPWIQWLDSPEQLAEVAATWSWVALHPEQRRILDAVTRLAAGARDADGRVPLPHTCYCLRYER